MVQTVQQEDRARDIADFKARKKFKSNGDGYSKNETKLEGQIVVFRAGKPKNDIIPIVAIGRLQTIRGGSGSYTSGIAWKTHNRDGKVVKRDSPIWMMRDQPAFSIKRFHPTNPRPDEQAFIERRDIILPTSSEKAEA